MKHAVTITFAQIGPNAMIHLTLDVHGIGIIFVQIAVLVVALMAPLLALILAKIWVAQMTRIALIKMSATTANMEIFSALMMNAKIQVALPGMLIVLIGIIVWIKAAAPMMIFAKTRGAALMEIRFLHV